MKTAFVAATAAALFVAGIGVGWTAKLAKADAAMYRDQAPQAAGDALLAIALEQTENGSWERIGVARVHYLAGHKAEAQAMFDRLLAGKHEAGDVYRIARVYAEAGDWPQAKAMFERFLAMGEVDEKEYATIGAYHLLNGDRAGAEAMFDRSLARDPRSTWATMAMAGAYLGVKPQE